MTRIGRPKKRKCELCGRILFVTEKKYCKSCKNWLRTDWKRFVKKNLERKYRAIKNRR